MYVLKRSRFNRVWSCLCPQVISTFFKYSNVVDLNNQVCQHSLALEKKWITQSAYFRLYTTHVGMNLKYTWKVMRLKYKRGTPIPTISRFADNTAYDMILYTTSLNVLIDDIPVINDSISIDSSPSSSARENNKSSTHTRLLLSKKQV